MIDTLIKRAILICDTSKTAESYRDIFLKMKLEKILVCSGGNEACERLVSEEFDIAVVNAPLKKESAEEIAIHIAEKNSCQVLLMVRNEYLDEVRSHTRDYGIITVGKPIHMSELQLAMEYIYAFQRRIAFFKNENKKLLKKINEMKVINQAKLLLIEKEGLNEEEAHKKIERIAMNDRVSRIMVAKEIIYRYETL